MAELQDEAIIKMLIGGKSGRAPRWGHYKDTHWLEQWQSPILFLSAYPHLVKLHYPPGFSFRPGDEKKTKTGENVSFLFSRTGTMDSRGNNSPLFADNVKVTTPSGCKRCNKVGVAMSGGPPALERYRLKRGRAPRRCWYYMHTKCYVRPAICNSLTMQS